MLQPSETLLRLAPVAAIVLGGLGATAAHAAPSPLTHNGFAAGSVNVSVGATNLGTTVGAAAGAFSVTWGGTTFFTYCVELTQTAVFGERQGYALMDGLSYFSTNFAPNALAAPAATVVDRLSRLFTATNGMPMPKGGDLGTWTYTAAQASAAMQLAVWEIVYEAGSGLAGLSLHNGGFTEKSNTVAMGRVRSLADSFLASAAGVTESRFDIGVLRKIGEQDYLLVTERPQRNDVPLPGTLALVGLGLLGLATVRRRRA